MRNTGIVLKNFLICIYQTQNVFLIHRALEPTIYPALQVWGFTAGENRVPEKEESQELLNSVDYQKVTLTDNRI